MKILLPLIATMLLMFAFSPADAHAVITSPHVRAVVAAGEVEDFHKERKASIDASLMKPIARWAGGQCGVRNGRGDTIAEVAESVARKQYRGEFVGMDDWQVKFMVAVVDEGAPLEYIKASPETKALAVIRGCATRETLEARARQATK